MRGVPTVLPGFNLFLNVFCVAWIIESALFDRAA
jgi:hypothetical protein